jgi:hypothetical protein
MAAGCGERKSIDLSLEVAVERREIVGVVKEERNGKKSKPTPKWRHLPVCFFFPPMSFFFVFTTPHYDGH